ncbi:MAG: glycosyltransferase, partial [Bifidobacteriaceae bacterium]|nr:glycosyltransferase [Bifidobacteriaceae bacterium]
MSDAVLTAGEETARLLRVAFPASRSRIWAVGNPIDSADFPFVERPAEAPLERWLYVGNLDASKGVFAVLKGFAAFAAARPGPDPQPPERPGGPDPRLEMAGQGPALEGLKELARRLGLADRVVFLGGLDRAGVAAAMARADLQIHLSPAETFGIAPLEGLLSGLPVLAVRNCGTAQTMPPAVAAGRAVLIDPPFGRRVGPRVAQAVARLEAAVRQAAPGAAQAVRDALERRYGTTHFGAIERRVAVGLPPFEPVPAPIPPGPARPAEPEVAQPPTASALAAGAAVPGPAGPGAAAEVAPSASEPLSSASALVAVALTDHGWGELAGRVGEALLAGRPVTVLTVDGGLAAGLDPRIESRLVADPAPWARPLAKLIGRLAAAPLKAAVAVERRAGRLRRRRKADGPPRMAERQLRLSAWRRRLEPTLRRAATSRRQIARLAAAAAAAAPTAEVITAPRELPEPGDGPFVSNS